MRFDKLFSSAHFSLLKTLIQKTFEGNKDTLQLHFLPPHWHINKLIQCCICKGINRISEEHAHFRHIFTGGHEIFWMYRSGRFGVSVIMLLTETSYTVQTYLQTFSESCEIQSLS